MQNEASTVRAVGYVRVSTSMQVDDGVSLDAQEHQVADYASREGWALVGVYRDEGRSGRTTERPEYQRMLADARRGQFERLICPALDRLGRSTKHTLDALDLLESLSIEVVFLRERIDTSTSAGRLLRTMLAALAQMESENIAARVQDSIGQRAREGRGHGGSPGYGYRFKGSRASKRSGMPGDGVRVVVPEQAAVVRRIFREYVGGASISAIAYALTEEGIPSPGGKSWGPSHISKLLRSKLYLGKVVVGGREYRGKHNPIVDETTWEDARRIREARGANARGRQGRYPSGAHLLTRGLLRCTCGAPMLPRTWRSGSSQRMLERYVCSKRIYYGRAACDQRPLNRADIDETILAYFESQAFDVEATREHVTAARSARLAEARVFREAAERDALRVSEALAKIERDYLSEELTPSAYSNLRERLASEQAAAEAEADRLRERESEAAEETALDAATDHFIERVAELRAAVAGRITSTQTIAAFRVALSALFERFDLRPVFGEGSPDVAYMDLCLLETEHVLVPKLRTEAIAGYVTHRGDAEVELPEPQRIALNLAREDGTLDPDTVQTYGNFWSGGTSRYWRSNEAICSNAGAATSPP